MYTVTTTLLAGTVGVYTVQIHITKAGLGPSADQSWA